MFLFNFFFKTDPFYMNAFPVMSNKTKGNKIISTHLILFQSQTKGKITTTGASLNFSDLFR